MLAPKNKNINWSFSFVIDFMVFKTYICIYKKALLKEIYQIKN